MRIRYDQLVGTTVAPQVALLLPLRWHYCCLSRGTTDAPSEVTLIPLGKEAKILSDGRGEEAML